jgi:superfamily II DNA/RNA helicase
MLPEMGVLTPSPIQEAAIPRILSGESIVIQSSTGSGKVRLPSE